MARKQYSNTTITLSIPHEVKAFLDQLADDGYNRSALMGKMIDIVHTLYYIYPQIPLPRGIARLQELVRDGSLLPELSEPRSTPAKDHDRS